MYCFQCGNENEDYALFCIKCGASMKQSGTKRLPPIDNNLSRSQYAHGKSPVLAMIISLIIVGGGQLYNGDYKKGYYMLIGAIVSGVFSAGILWFIIAIWSAADAYQVANRDKTLWV